MWFIYSLDPARGKVLLAGGVTGASSGLGEAGNNLGGDVEPGSLPPFFFCRQSPVRVRRSHKNELASQVLFYFQVEFILSFFLPFLFDLAVNKKATMPIFVQIFG